MTAQLIVYLLGDAKGQRPPKMGKGSGVRPLPNPQPMQYHSAWALHRSNKGQCFYAGMEGVGDNPGCQLQESAGTPERLAIPAPVLCVCTRARPADDMTVPAAPRECWMHRQGRVPMWFLSLSRCGPQDAIAEPLWDCVFLCFFFFLFCLVWQIAMDRERTYAGGQNVEENHTSKLVKILCNASVLGNKLGVSRDCWC